MLPVGLAKDILGLGGMSIRYMAKYEQENFCWTKNNLPPKGGRPHAAATLGSRVVVGLGTGAAGIALASLAVGVP